MKIIDILKILPQIIENHYDLFPLEELQDLSSTINSLDNNPELVIDTLKKWVRNHEQSRDILIDFAPKRQLKTSGSRQPVEEAEIIRNLFEFDSKLKKIIEEMQKNKDQN